MKRSLLIAFALNPILLFAADTVTDIAPPSYKEIPYYLRKLEETKLEDERLRFGKFLHEAVVNADLSDKKVVRELEPLIERLQKAQDSGLDTVSLTGQTNWIQSAIEYFEREKFQPVLDIPEADWTPSEPGKNGPVLSTYPEKIMVHKQGKSEQIVEDSNIHEAVLSRDGRWVAYYRLIEPQGKKAELWSVNVANKKKRKIASVDSCYTILFSLDGGKVYFQAVPEKAGRESDIFVVSRGGGRPNRVAQAALLQSVIEKGRYKGNLILYQTVLHHLGVTRLQCPYAYSEGGKNLGRLVNAPCR